MQLLFGLLFWYQKVMSHTISDTRKKRGRPIVGATAINVRLPPDELAQLDAWINAMEPQPSRPEAIRRLIELGLQATQQQPAEKAKG